MTTPSRWACGQDEMSEQKRGWHAQETEENRTYAVELCVIAILHTGGSCLQGCNCRNPEVSDAKFQRGAYRTSSLLSSSRFSSSGYSLCRRSYRTKSPGVRRAEETIGRYIQREQFTRVLPVNEVTPIVRRALTMCAAIKRDAGVSSSRLETICGQECGNTQSWR